MNAAFSRHILQRGSYTRYISMFVCFFLFAQMFALAMLFAFNTRYNREQFNRTAENIIESSLNRLTTLLSQADNDLQSILSYNAQIRVLCGNNDNARVLAAHTVHEIMNDHIASGVADAYTLYSHSNDTFLISRAPQVSYSSAKALKTYTVALLENDVPSSTWHLDQIGSDWYLVRCYSYSAHVLGAFFSLSTLMREMPYYGVLKPGQQLTFMLGELPLAYIGSCNTDSFRFEVASSIDGLSVVYSHERNEKALNTYFLLYIAAVCALGIVIVFLLIVYLQKELLRPLNELVHTAHVVRSGNLEYRANTACRNPDMHTLSDAMNDMIDTITHQRISAYEQIIARKEAELKYLHAQLRPHFFLNALSSINGMTWQNDMPRIRRFIDLFSQHIRYLFSAGYQTIPLDEEVAHVRSYLECQEILYPDYVFSYIEIDPSTKGWPVPMLLLNTFVENVFKHTVSSNRPISLFIHGAIEKIDGEEFLHLQIEDDGIGFPQDVLDMVAHYSGGLPDGRGRIGILNISYTLYLMYSRTDLLSLSNNKSGGGHVSVLVPTAPQPLSDMETRAL